MDLLIRPQQNTLIANNIRLSHLRNPNFAVLMEVGSYTTDGTLRNVHIHDNVLGDSSLVLPHHRMVPMVRLYRVDLSDAHVHDNRMIIPAEPNIGQTYGNYLSNGGFVALHSGSRRVENLLFEDNTLDDLDDYSNPWPTLAPIPNYAREFLALCDTVRVKDVAICRSRQPNHCPEMYLAGNMTYSGPGSVLGLVGHRVEVEHLLLEDCDDGGVFLWADTLLMEHVVIRNVGRMGVGFSNNFDPEARPYYRFRNVLIENVDAQDNWLLPQWQHLSQQAALFVGVVGHGPGWPVVYPMLDLQNVTITGCDNMQHLFNFYEPATLRMRNGLLFNNTYGQLAEWDDPITQDWAYCLVEEVVPGEGNLIDLDPRFDSLLGPPFLAADSPCIDAGDPDSSFNDLEDPAAPGFALWPSQGSLRNDMGFTGGPRAAVFDTAWVALPRWEPRTQPQAYTLGAPWPNPFNPVTRIPLTLQHPMPVRLVVHNLLGQQVAVLVDGLLPAGTHHLPFQAGRLASGLYLVTLEAAGRAQTRTVTLLR
jgi:hypothetical protein